MNRCWLCYVRHRLLLIWVLRLILAPFRLMLLARLHELAVNNRSRQIRIVDVEE